MAGDSLSIYRSKRNFDITSEPAEGGEANVEERSFVIQKHWASRLHYDFRLELDGTMKSWAVPKGPSFDSRDKRMAVHVEDHPISYNSFEGMIPEKQYGAGKVIIWDKGTWIPLGDPKKGYRDGNLKFELRGHKLHGRWVLVRMKGKGEKQEPWLLIKEKDAFTRPASAYSVVDEMPDSVAALPALDGTQPTGDKPAAAKNGNGKRGNSARKTATVDVSATTKPARKQRGAASSNTAAHPHAGPPPGAVPAPLPESFSPQLATLVDAPPADADNWLYEIKFDGYRIVARIDGDDVRLVTRNGHDWTAKLPALAQALKSMQLPSCWLDGEIVVADENGLPDFQALQNAFDTARTQKIAYYVFDLPYCADHDLRQVPLIERRRILQMMLQRTPSELVRYSDSFDASVQDLLASSCRIGLEGLIGKRKDSSYVTRRSRDWIKLKCVQRQEFVIGGFTDPKGSRKGIGSLLLGVHDQEGNLLYAGNVGTGFSERTLTELRRQLDAVASDKNPFSSETDTGKAHWVKPVLVAEVSFGEWTNTGRIRHSVFHGLRTDKKARNIVREQATHVNGNAGTSTNAHTNTNTKPADTSAELPGTLPRNFKVTHGERVVDVQSRLTKIDLIRYYALVAPLMMEHLKGRPVSLVRAPDGIGGQLFFQKHMEHKLDGIVLLDQALDPEHASLMEVAKPLGLLSAAQMNVVEFHTWNAVKTAIGTPDRMTFDLDPGEGVEWSTMQEATLLMKSFLDQIGLKSFAKTSGGKGMHVIVPLKRQYDWDTVKDFSKAIVEHMASTLPMRFVAKSGPKNRIGKIFIDYLRNGFGATTVSAWSVRSRPGLGVSVPVGWDEIEKLHGSAQWHVANIHTRLDRGNAPWQAYARSAQSLTAAMRMLGFVPVKQK